jgi:uncharacterized damage-inducible protein DinB
MERSDKLSERIRELYLDGSWIANTNFKNALADVPFGQAVLKFGDLNSIVALTFHVNYYLEGLLKVFHGGGPDMKDEHSFRHPLIADSASWKAMTDGLSHNAERFAEAVRGMEECRLEEIFIKEDYGTVERNIEAVIEHGYYHLGQIVLIKKLLNGFSN